MSWSKYFEFCRLKLAKKKNILNKFLIKQRKSYLLQCYLCTSNNTDGITFWPIFPGAGLRNSIQPVSSYFCQGSKVCACLSNHSFDKSIYLSTDPTNTSEEDISLFCISESSQNFFHTHAGKIHVSSLLSHMKMYVHHWTYSCLSKAILNVTWLNDQTRTSVVPHEPLHQSTYWKMLPLT